MDFGSAVSRAHGLDDEDLLEINRWRDSERYSDDDRLVLELAEAMTRTPAEVPDGLWERLHARFTPEQLVELTMTIATENLISRFNRAFDIQPQGFSEGAVCVLPDP